MGKCIYRERVRPPKKLLCAVACIVGVAVCWSSYSGITASLASMPPFSAIALAFLFVSLSGYAVGMFTYGVRIKVTIGGGIGYEQGVVFSTLGTGHSGRLYVLASDITSVEGHTFDQSSIFRPYGSQGQLSGSVVKLPWYEGSGLRITYSHSPLYDSGRIESVLYLPTRNPDALKTILRSERT